MSMPMALTLITLLAIALALAASSCKSKSKNTSVSSSNETTSGQSATVAPATPQVATPATPVVVVKKKKPAVKRASTVTYSNNAYGLMFRYPQKYKLVPVEKTDKDFWPEPVPMNFVEAGGVSVATIGQTANPASSFFKVSVNKNLTAAQCEQFAAPAPSEAASNTPVDSSDESIPAKESIHGLDFSRVENATELTDVKYYHHFENGACYEFALGVEDAPDKTKAVDYVALFDRLERILSTVKIKSEATPAVTASVPASPTTESKPQ
jgi:hypothetical protein